MTENVDPPREVEGVEEVEVDVDDTEYEEEPGTEPDGQCPEPSQEDDKATDFGTP